MGRNTHEAADKPRRRRIVFSTTRQGWLRETQLWLDPQSLSPADLAALVRDVHPLSNGLILGGTKVHDWFLEQGAIDKVHLTVEPVEFTTGLPIFTSQASCDPLQVFTGAGFDVVDTKALNSTGTKYYELARREPER